jgi:ATP-dependent DNA helicase MPH1
MESDEYDDLDDSAFLAAATQFDPANSPSFRGSARVPKRRKIGHIQETTASIPPRIGRNKAIAESGDEDSFTASPTSSRGSPVKGPRLLSTITSSVRRSKRSTSKGKENGDLEDEGTPVSRYAKKKLDRIHKPVNVQEVADVFYTQPPPEHSPPWKMRGAIWTKPTMSTDVHCPSGPSMMQTWTGQDEMRTMSLTERQSEDLDLSLSPRDVEDSPRLPSANGALREYDPTHELADLPSDAFASSSSSPQKQDEDIVLVSEKRKVLVAPMTGLRQTTLFGRQGANGDVPPSQVNKRYNFVAVQKEEPPTHHKLDPEAMKTWVYPTNLGKERDYQFNIVARGLFHNLLVALPTGLGKTFIAATIMLNWFRWTKDAQIVFVAPTRPLVAQQVAACYGIAGIPRSQTTMMTGGIPIARRAEEWQSKRVFFMTPQTFLNDLKSGIADPKKIVLLVVDEAHKATGSYAYVELVTFLRRFNPSYRVLALTATPGSDVEAVQKVIDGLDIARIEIRTENSLDITKYVHHREVEKHVFEDSDEMEMCKELYSAALQPSVSTIAGLNAFWSRNPLDLTPYGCTQARAKWFREAGSRAPMPQKAMVNFIFSMLGSLSHGMELLKYHGIGPFYMKMKEFRDAQTKSKSKYKKEICESEPFKKLMVRLQSWVTNENFTGHPKLDYLQGVLLEHFGNAAEGQNVNGAPPSQTRIMVFAHFRDSAEEIVRVLKKHEPMIRPRVFVGQSSGKNSDGMNQKEQLNVIDQFKMGTFNTLVATSIGEEGLDIGEVDLIVCYDSKASPIRMLQRMGRTGRKHQGKIVLLQMKGKEESDAEKAKDNYEKMQELIAEGSRFTFHHDVSRKILPPDARPVVDKRVVEIPLENTQSDFPPEPKRGGRAPKRPPKKFHMPDGVISGFLTANGVEIAPKPGRKTKAAPTYPSEQEFQIPPLDSVLLDDAATRDLERRYQTVFDEDESAMVGPLLLGEDTARQRVLSRTSHFPQPGRVSQKFVETMRQMHTVDIERIDGWRSRLHHSDCESEPEESVIVSDTPQSDEEIREDDEDIWASDDPASQPAPKPKAKPGPKPREKKTSKPKPPPETSKAAAPRSRPRKSPSASISPAQQPKGKAKSKTTSYRMDELVDEGDSSSPPPTDPGMRLASQAIDLGSDDTLGEEDIEDTQAYRLDSDLRDFIAEDDENVSIPDSSLPTLSLEGVGIGTQAVVMAAKPKRPRRAEKIFTSDPTDDDAIVSSDSDDDEPIRNGNHSTSNRYVGYVVDSATEDEGDDNDGPPIVPPRKRARRVIDDDEDEDDE